jgi:hypothetical protein
VYLDDHLTKEDKFFDNAQNQVLSQEEEKMMYEEFRAVTAVITKFDDLAKSIDYLESTHWMKN